MSRFGRACAAGAVVVALAAVACWDRGAPPGRTSATASGAELFRAKGCAGCHDGPATSALVGGFPSLRGATDWAGQRRDELSARAYLAESIATPDAFIAPGYGGATSGMPTLTLTGVEVDALVDYLLTG